MIRRLDRNEEGLLTGIRFELTLYIAAGLWLLAKGMVSLMVWFSLSVAKSMARLGKINMTKTYL